VENSKNIEDIKNSYDEGNGVCPFCGEEGFDLIGLKGHLENGSCEKYNELEYNRSIFS
jgi:hypothetical protein